MCEIVDQKSEQQDPEKAWQKVLEEIPLNRKFFIRTEAD